jgi:hypothetical protein
MGAVAALSIFVSDARVPNKHGENIVFIWFGNGKGSSELRIGKGSRVILQETRLTVNDSPPIKPFLRESLKKTSWFWQNTQTPPTEFSDEANDFRRCRVRRQTQADP